MKTLYDTYININEGILTDIDKTIEVTDDLLEIYDFINDNYDEIPKDKLIISKHKINGKYHVSADALVTVKNINIQSLVNDLFVWDNVRSFVCNKCKNLKSLEGAPKKCIHFNCTFCYSLTNLIGAPEEIDTEFNCDYCKNLSSLEGIKWKSIYHFSCKGTSIELPARELKKIVHSQITSTDYRPNKTKKLTTVTW